MKLVSLPWTFYYHGTPYESATLRGHLESQGREEERKEDVGE